MNCAGKEEKKRGEKGLYASSSTFGRLTTSQGNNAKGGQKNYVLREAPLGTTPHRDLNPALLSQLLEEYLCGLQTTSISPFMARTKILLLIMTKHLTSLFPGVAPQCIELEQLPLSTKTKTTKTKREITGIKRPVLCAL